MNFHGKLGLGNILILESSQLKNIPHLTAPFSLAETTSPFFRTVIDGDWGEHLSVDILEVIDLGRILAFLTQSSAYLGTTLCGRPLRIHVFISLTVY